MTRRHRPRPALARRCRRGCRLQPDRDLARPHGINKNDPDPATAPFSGNMADGRRRALPEPRDRAAAADPRHQHGRAPEADRRPDRRPRPLRRRSRAPAPPRRRRRPRRRRPRPEAPSAASAPAAAAAAPRPRAAVAAAAAPVAAAGPEPCGTAPPPVAAAPAPPIRRQPVAEAPPAATPRRRRRRPASRRQTRRRTRSFKGQPAEVAADQLQPRNAAGAHRGRSPRPSRPPLPPRRACAPSCRRRRPPRPRPKRSASAARRRRRRCRRAAADRRRRRAAVIPPGERGARRPATTVATPEIGRRRRRPTHRPGRESTGSRRLYRREAGGACGSRLCRRADRAAATRSPATMPRSAAPSRSPRRWPMPAFRPTRSRPRRRRARSPPVGSTIQFAP